MVLINISVSFFIIAMLNKFYLNSFVIDLSMILVIFIGIAYLLIGIIWIMNEGKLKWGQSALIAAAVSWLIGFSTCSLYWF